MYKTSKSNTISAGMLWDVLSIFEVYLSVAQIICRFFYYIAILFIYYQRFYMKNFFTLLLSLLVISIKASALTPVTGTLNVCVSGTTTLGNTTPGGAWTSGTTSIATVNVTTGVVTGIAAGTAELTYTVGVDFSTAVVTVSATPNAGPISGPSVVCIGNDITLTGTIPGGTWISTNTVTGTIVIGTGILTGVNTGTTTISYTANNGCGAASTTTNVTVSPAPAAGTISGVSELCAGSNSVFTTTGTGGVWSSTNTTAATISTTGTLTGLANGVTSLSYTASTGCATVAATKTVTINPLPTGITGTLHVCQGLTTTLNSTPSGGTWSSPDITVTIDGTAGAISGAGAGTALISYTLATGCRTTVIFTVDPTPALIGGSFIVCTGATTTLTNTTIGGSWSSSNAAVATINATSGVMSGLTVGTTVVTYAAGGCNTTGVISVGLAPVPGTISGASAVCTGNTISLTNTGTGGSWSSSNVARATVNASGVVTGLTAGTTTISYTVTVACGSAAATHIVTVNQTPTTITGTFTICAGSSETLASTPAGGSWSSSNIPVASVNATTGTVSGLTAGTANIVYTSTGCTSNQIVTINPLPAAGTITGPTAVCTGSDITLTDGTTGGVWSSSDVAVATTGTSGVVSGIAAGTATISYAVTTVCGTATATHTITVNAVPTAIGGTLDFCQGTSETLTSTPAGGVWSSSNTAIATVGSATGITAGIATGTARISYTLSGCRAIQTITINALPTAGTITGPATVCTGNDILLLNATSGGSWTSSNTAVATVGTLGFVTGITTGSTVISYTVTNSCGSASATKGVTVNTVPATGTIAGPATACMGSTITQTNSIGTGTWSSSNLVIATISGSGVVMPLAVGTTTISYTRTNGCGNASATRVITVNPLPSLITGTAVVCKTFTTTLANADAGGTWSSTGPWVAVGSASGLVTGMNAGTGVVSYTLPTGCRRTTIVTVNPQPTVITGVRHVCEGATTTIVNLTGGGTWSSSDNSIAMIGSSGIVTGLVPGTAIMTYTLPTGCYVSAEVTVNIMPTPITGIQEVCVAATTTLSSTPSGGLWNSGNSSIATVVAATGVVTGQSMATVRITYTTTGSCKQVAVVTVHPTPGVITGTTSVCEGGTTTLANAVPGGVWTSSTSAVAGVVISSGVVGGIIPGTAIISYTLSTGCYRSTMVTVRPLPAPITGPGAVCTGASINLTSSPSGGSWSSSDATAVTGTPAGMVTGISIGTAMISYTLPTGCLRTTAVTVNPSPSAITGTTNICIGANTLLSSMPLTGTWTSSTPGVATIGSTAGLVTSVGTGTTRITYTVPVTGCVATTIVTINPLPAVITGPDSVCVGPSFAMSNTSPGGSWSSSDITIAVANPATGIVTGVAPGTVTITYMMPAGCYSTKSVTIKAIPAPVLVTGATAVCQTDSITLTATVAGGTWATTTGKVTVSAAGVVTGIAGGFDTVRYTTTNLCGTSVVKHRVNVNPLPSPAPIAGNPTVCIGSTRTLLNTTPGGSWVSTDTSVAKISAAGIVTPVAAGTTTISYTVTNLCGSTTLSVNFTVNPLADPGVISGPNTVCKKETIQLFNTVSTGGWSLDNASLASINATGAVYGRNAGTVIIRYIVSNMCNRDTAEYEVTVVPTEVCLASAGPNVTVQQPAITIYPNPTNGTFAIKTPGSGMLDLFTIDGRLVTRFEVAGKTADIQMPRDLKAGVYVCRFTNDDGTTTNVRLVYEP